MGYRAFNGKILLRRILEIRYRIDNKKIFHDLKKSCNLI